MFAGTGSTHIISNEAKQKNLPNRKTLGKQDPYCVARIGKEAKRTEPDKRGGQTPRWLVIHAGLVQWTNDAKIKQPIGTRNSASKSATPPTTVSSNSPASTTTRKPNLSANVPCGSTKS